MILLDFDAPTKVYGSNEVNNWRWPMMTKVRGQWHAAVAEACKGSALKELPPSAVRLRIVVSSERKRDPSNYVGTVTKWIVDEIVRAGVWPDDDPRYLTIMSPVFVKQAKIACPRIFVEVIDRKYLEDLPW